ncbi:hypothetical protein PMAYCL1PPCAC_18747, partial [Pristionchus mayeri]
DDRLDEHQDHPIVERCVAELFDDWIVVLDLHILYVPFPGCPLTVRCITYRLNDIPHGDIQNVPSAGPPLGGLTEYGHVDEEEVESDSTHIDEGLSRDDLLRDFVHRRTLLLHWTGGRGAFGGIVDEIADDVPEDRRITILRLSHWPLPCSIPSRGGVRDDSISRSHLLSV